MKTVATIALTLALGVVVPAKTHQHQQEAAQGVASNISDTNAWRHYMLHIALPAPARSPIRRCPCGAR
jgi:hypothetical protein